MGKYSNDFLPKKIDKRSENMALLGAIILFLTIFTFIYIENHDSLKEIKKSHAYAVGTVRDYSTSRTGRALDFTFSYKDDAYVGGFKFYGNDEKFAIGKKFLVIFNPNNPENKFLIPFSLPDNMFSPSEGWKTPPLSISEKDVWKYLDEKY